jgi:sphingosine kinase
MSPAPDFFLENGNLHVTNSGSEDRTQYGIRNVLSACCGPSKSDSTRMIPVSEVLWVQYENDQLLIDYARRTNKKRPVARLTIDSVDKSRCVPFAEKLLEAAYRPGYSPPRVKVLLNPIGGTGKALSIWKHKISQILRAAHYVVELQETQYAGHASDIAGQLDLTQFDAIWCISGDGLPHEVINGLGRRKDAMAALQLPIGVVPAGSGNGTAKSVHNTNNPITCAINLIKGVVTPIDLVHITQGTRSLLSYFSTSYGLIAEGDVGTDHLRWMGEIRFEVGVLRRILTRTAYPCELALSLITDDKDKIRNDFRTQRELAPNNSGPSWEGPGLPPLKYGSVNDPVPATWQKQTQPNMGTFFAGFFPFVSSTACFCPTAIPASGELDVLYLPSDLPVMTALSVMTEVDSAKHFDNPHCYYAKCDAFRITPTNSRGFISIDGEKLPFEPFQAEVVRGLARIITRDGKYLSHFHNP